VKLEPFALERWQSEWEHHVLHNLSESGVHALMPSELLTPDEQQELLHQPLIYIQTNGTEALRSAIAALYPGATLNHVIVTNGSAEANFVATWRILEPGDEVVMVLPNYMQLFGVVRSFGATVVPVPLREDQGWAPDIEALDRAVNPKTRLIVVCNPNNPTGAVLSEDAMGAIVKAASRYGSWILADEIYRGAERDGRETPSFWGRYERVLATGSLSKAYGLPGLRIGWAVTPVETSGELWLRKDYLTIAPSALSDYLARKALAKRSWILDRTRTLLNTNYPVLETWLRRRASTLRFVPPRAGAITYVGYPWKVNSTELVKRLKDDQKVLIVAGDHFGMDGYLRLGFGNEPRDLAAGLARIDTFLDRLAA
jgi:aspartate/methionine/tyrosine aminotransferase